MESREQLTEVARARLATPIYVEPGELRGGVKGLPEYTRRANYPTPWTCSPVPCAAARAWAPGST